MLIQRLTTSLLLIVSVLTCSNVFAQVTTIEGRSIRPRGASPVGEFGRIYKIKVNPAKETSPAFRYRLVLPPHETIPGNSITHYLRSDGEGSLSGPWKSVNEESENKAHEWLSLSTATEDIPIAQLMSCSAKFNSYVENHLERATRCRKAEWGIEVEDFRGIESFNFLLPSAQQTRSMVMALMLQNRLAIIEKRYEDAVDRLRMAYKIGHDVNEMGFLVTSLIGVSEVDTANDGALLLIAADGSPNLYWALSELDRPIINQRRVLRLEASMPIRVFPELMDIENVDYSNDQWKKLLNKYTKSVGEFMQMQVNHPTKAPAIETSELFSFAIGISGYANAKRRMLERGYEENEIDSMCVAQVILTDAILDVKHFSQELEKATYLTYEDAAKLSQKWDENIRKEESTMRLGAIVAGLFAPALQQVRQSSYKVQAKINLMITIESLRNHAAIYGTFPESLSELELPPRDNPMTGKPFAYSLESEKAILTYDAGPWEPQRYELSLKK